MTIACWSCWRGHTRRHGTLQDVPSQGRRRELFSASLRRCRQVAARDRAKAEEQLLELLVKLNVGPESGLGGGRAGAVRPPGLRGHPLQTAGLSSLTNVSGR